jgi:hypothetical protein
VYLAVGVLCARPGATMDEIESALRLNGFGPLAWQTARDALERPARRLRVRP